MEDAKFYTQETATINGRGVWHYLISCPIGYIHIIQYETPTMEIKEKIIRWDNDAAERAFQKACKDVLAGK